MSSVEGTLRIQASVEFAVRFGEVDAQGVVWHGNYLRYCELARDELLRKGGLRPSDVFAAGYSAPIVDCDLRYLAPLRLDDRARVECELAWQGVPRLDLEYRVVRLTDSVVACEATTRQVITDRSGELVLVLPDFLRAWAERLGLERPGGAR
jgi:acyl-CoA thioester hydrolase